MLANLTKQDSITLNYIALDKNGVETLTITINVFKYNNDVRRLSMIAVDEGF